MHPYLAPVALSCRAGSGARASTAAVSSVDGGVWAVLGDKTAGKSTTLAWLARAGVGVVSDDVLIVDGETVLAGPRSIDLREEAARAPRHRRADRAASARATAGASRSRPSRAELPLRGWITLEWGEAVAVEPIRGAERLTPCSRTAACAWCPPSPPRSCASAACRTCG